MEAWQHVELTGTNRPSGLASTTSGLGGDSQTRVHASTVRFPRCGRAPHLHIVSVAIAKGKHPVPFRTRKLSPSAPMVLRGGPRGRVGRRRTSSLRPLPVGSGLNCVMRAVRHPGPQPQPPSPERYGRLGDLPGMSAPSGEKWARNELSCAHERGGERGSGRGPGRRPR